MAYQSRYAQTLDDTSHTLEFKMELFEYLHSDWQNALERLHPNFQAIDRALEAEVIAPTYSNVMRALTTSIESTRVIIIGQDPYPTPGIAQGLAFSVAKEVSPLPPSLRNIFKELHNDCEVAIPSCGDLSHWSEQGVLLLNRILTTRQGQSLAHIDLGWQVITNEVARILGERSVIAILWGKMAQELSPHFKKELIIASVHPSPLSAYRGFFGSKPFSTVNAILTSRGQSAIRW